MSDLTTVIINIVATIVARSSQRAIGHRDHHLAILTGVHIAIIGRIDRNAPIAPLGIATTAGDLTSDLDHIVFNIQPFDLRCNTIDRITLGNRVEIKLQTRIVLDNSLLLDTHLVHSDKLQQRIDIGLCLRLTPRKAVCLGQRCNRYVVHSVADRVDAARQRQHQPNMQVGRVGLVAIDTADERGRIEDRHRGGHLVEDPIDRLLDFGDSITLGTCNDSVCCADPDAFDTHVFVRRGGRTSDHRNQYYDSRQTVYQAKIQGSIHLASNLFGHRKPPTNRAQRPKFRTKITILVQICNSRTKK